MQIPQFGICASPIHRFLAVSLLAILAFGQPTISWSQETPAAAEPTPASTADNLTPPAAGTTPAEQPAKNGSLIKQGEAKIDELSRTVDASPEAQKLSAGILNPIYQLAEVIAHPLLYWVAFMLMTTGVVSFALQLVIGKLVVLTRMHINFTEILGDALGLVISLIGLVFTTQAAAENSTFAQSAASVLSATVLGVVLGFIFYLWGQRQELNAARSAKAGH
ncbi:MAG: hypothetical protein C0478_08880 [Planctomyces sp.]|nr:hypothetical protein [Planctomyces sp.]